ncbi:MAG: Tim44 domain-containing protein [Alphaproteobacteria bacterium]|nr:Tim44 domain-containing protein [Alphaproteobacteria bacterium]
MLLRRGRIATALVVGLLVMAPALAEAAAGGRSSMGSRGSRTYDSGAGRTIERSTTAPQSPAMTRQATPQTAPAAPGAAGGMQQRPGFGMGSPIMTGIMAGLAGSFIGNMLFGSQNAAQAAQNPEASPTGSFIGSLLPWLVIGGIGFLAFTFFRRRSEASRMSPQALARGPVDLTGLRGGPGGGAGGGFGASPAQPDIDVTTHDQETFGRLLLDIQSAWGRHDTEALKPLLTREMASYFAGQLAELKGRGLTNKVEDVTLLKGEGTEAWSENGIDYATAILRWSARDYTVDASGNVVEGDAQRPVETEEVWTFIRQPGDNWRLSAIQQV